MFKNLIHRYYFFIALICLPTLAVANDRAYIISGFDDVLRQAENTSLAKAAIKLFENDKTFSGMPELYMAISHVESDPKFVVISATSDWFKGRITDFLAGSKYPENRLCLRNWLTQWSIENFKIKKLNEVLAEKPARKFIVIFDNSDASISMARTFQKDFSDKISAVYLREVVKKDLPASVHPFFTAFDIAVAENLADRMTLPEVQTVADAVLKENEVDKLFPSYALCPTRYDPCQKTKGPLKEVCSAVRTHVQNLCKRREY